MEKSKSILIFISIVFLAVLGFVIWDLYLNNNNLPNINSPPNNPSQKNDSNQKQNNLGSTNSNNQGTTSNTSFSSCINNTKDNPECKDCCDCLSNVDGDTRTSCRDTCAVHDFSKNSNFIIVTAPSTLGENGDYSTCTTKASSAECKTCCEGSLGLQCGDYRHCRTACNNKFGTTSGPQV